MAPFAAAAGQSERGVMAIFTAGRFRVRHFTQFFLKISFLKQSASFDRLECSSFFSIFIGISRNQSH